MYEILILFIIASCTRRTSIYCCVAYGSSYRRRVLFTVIGQLNISQVVLIVKNFRTVPKLKYGKWNSRHLLGKSLNKAVFIMPPATKAANAKDAAPESEGMWKGDGKFTELLLTIFQSRNSNKNVKS